MSTKASFTDNEWTLIRIVPSLVASGVCASDPSGIFGAIKESAAGAMEMVEALKEGANLELLNAMKEDRSFPSMPDAKSLTGEGTREQQMANLKNSVLAKVTEAVNLVSQKASPEEANAYKKMLLDIAERAANASKEGGFLGFGGVRVSTAEQTFINEVKSALQLA